MTLQQIQECEAFTPRFRYVVQCNKIFIYWTGVGTPVTITYELLQFDGQNNEVIIASKSGSLNTVFECVPEGDFTIRVTACLGGSTSTYSNCGLCQVTTTPFCCKQFDICNCLEVCPQGTECIDGACVTPITSNVSCVHDCHPDIPNPVPLPTNNYANPDPRNVNTSHISITAADACQVQPPYELCATGTATVYQMQGETLQEAQDRADAAAIANCQANMGVCHYGATICKTVNICGTDYVPNNVQICATTAQNSYVLADIQDAVDEAYTNWLAAYDAAIANPNPPCVLNTYSLNIDVPESDGNIWGWSLQIDGGSINVFNYNSATMTTVTILGITYRRYTAIVPQNAVVTITKTGDPIKGYWSRFTGEGATSGTTTTFTMPANTTTTVLHYNFNHRRACRDNSPPYNLQIGTSSCPPGLSTVTTPVGQVKYKYWVEEDIQTLWTSNSGNPLTGYLSTDEEIYVGATNPPTIAGTEGTATCQFISTCIEPIHSLMLTGKGAGTSGASIVDFGNLQYGGLGSLNVDGNFVIELWLYLPDINPFDRDQFILSKLAGTSIQSNNGFYFRQIVKGTYGFEIASELLGTLEHGFCFNISQGSSGVNSAFAYLQANLLPKVWNHIIITKSNPTLGSYADPILTVYLNGLPYSKPTRNGAGGQTVGYFGNVQMTGANNNPMYLGGTIATDIVTQIESGQPFGNSFAAFGNLKVYQGTTTQTEITNAYNAFLAVDKTYVMSGGSITLLQNVKFNETNGTAASDSTANNYNGNVRGLANDTVTDTQDISLSYSLVPGTYTYTEDYTTVFDNTPTTGHPPFGNTDLVPAWVEI